MGELCFTLEEIEAIIEAVQNSKIFYDAIVKIQEQKNQDDIPEILQRRRCLADVLEKLYNTFIFSEKDGDETITTSASNYLDLK